MDLEKKSTPVTMISSFIIASFLYSGDGNFNLYSTVGVPIAFMLADILIVYITIRNIEKKRCSMLII